MEYLYHDEHEFDAPEVLNRIRNNDPSLTHLVVKLSGTPTPSFYQNLAKDLQDNSNITHLTINGIYDIKYIPNVFQPIFESSKFINTLEIDFSDDLMDKIHAIVDDVFDSLIKSKNNKITKLKIFVEENIVEPLTKFLSTNMENQMMKLILQQKMGTEAASKISDELFPPNSIKELELVLDKSSQIPESVALLEAIGHNRSLESLRINSCSFDQVDFNFKLIIALENILSNNKSLKKLHLTIKNIDREGIKKVAMAIQKSPSLESFEFHTFLKLLLLNIEHIKDEIRKRFAKISDMLLLTKYNRVLHIQVFKHRRYTEATKKAGSK